MNEMIPVCTTGAWYDSTMMFVPGTAVVPGIIVATCLLPGTRTLCVYLVRSAVVAKSYVDHSSKSSSTAAARTNGPRCHTKRGLLVVYILVFVMDNHSKQRLARPRIHLFIERNRHRHVLYLIYERTR